MTDNYEVATALALAGIQRGQEVTDREFGMPTAQAIFLLRPKPGTSALIIVLHYKFAYCGHLGKKVSVFIKRTLWRTSLSRRSGMDHTVLPAITPVPAFTSWAFIRWRLPRLRLRTSNCSLLLIYLPRKDERLVCWPTSDGLLVNCRSSAGHGKFAGQKPTFYHRTAQPTILSYWTVKTDFNPL